MTYPLALSSIYNLYRLFFNLKKEIYSGNALMILLAIGGKKTVDILLADDDADDRDLFIQVMKEASPEVNITTAVNGEDVLKQLGTGYRPDIIFLDLNMPVMGGYECLKEIKARKELKGIPVVIYSTSSSQEHVKETFEQGANLYIAKPDSYTGLQKMAKKVLTLNWSERLNPAKESFLLKF